MSDLIDRYNRENNNQEGTYWYDSNYGPLRGEFDSLESYTSENSVQITFDEIRGNHTIYTLEDTWSQSEPPITIDPIMLNVLQAGLSGYLWSSSISLDTLERVASNLMPYINIYITNISEDNDEDVIYIGLGYINDEEQVTILNIRAPVASRSINNTGITDSDVQIRERMSRRHTENERETN